MRLERREGVAYIQQMTKATSSLSGQWQGLYSYPRYLEPVYFVATLISFGSQFSGTTHEASEGRSGAALKSFALVDGSLGGNEVSFLKTYDGSADRSHSITYNGTLSVDGLEIEGTWSIPGDWSGRFLMIRNTGATEKLVREVYEKV
jgi:hypothetical protein